MYIVYLFIQFLYVLIQNPHHARFNPLYIHNIHVYIVSSSITPHLIRGCSNAAEEGGGDTLLELLTPYRV